MSNTLTPSFNGTITGIEGLAVQPFTYTGQPIELSGLAGALEGAFLRGRSLAAKVSVTISGDVVASKVDITDSIPFVPSSLASFTELVTLTGAEAAVVTAIIPQGATIEGTVTLS